MRAMLDPSRDLAGATPETLARALLRPLGPRSAGSPVVGNEVPVKKVPANKPRDGSPHLRKRS